MKFKLFIFGFLIINSICLKSQGKIPTFPELREIASKSNFFLKGDFENYKDKGEVIDITYVMDPFDLEGHFALQFYLVAMKGYENLNFQILYHFETHPFSNTFPDSTLNEIKVHLSINKHYPDKFHDFLLLRGDSLFNDWETVALKVDIDPNKIKTDILNGTVDQRVQENFLSTKELKNRFKNLMKSWAAKDPFIYMSNERIFRPVKFFFAYNPIKTE